MRKEFIVQHWVVRFITSHPELKLKYSGNVSLDNRRIACSKKMAMRHLDDAAKTLIDPRILDKDSIKRENGYWERKLDVSRILTMTKRHKQLKMGF